MKRKMAKSSTTNYVSVKKDLLCNCGRLVKNVANNAVAVRCWLCVAKEAGLPEGTEIKVKSDKPKGWKFMKEYVHTDGTVYHKGVEQPSLKGTLPVTVIQAKDVVRKTKQQKSDETGSIARQITGLKKELEAEKNPKARKAIDKKINILNKKLSKLI